MLIDTAAPCEGKVVIAHFPGPAHICGDRRYVAWSPVYRKWLCAQCLEGATRLRLSRHGEADWVESFGRGVEVRVG